MSTDDAKFRPARRIRVNLTETAPEVPREARTLLPRKGNRQTKAYPPARRAALCAPRRRGASSPASPP